MSAEPVPLDHRRDAAALSGLVSGFDRVLRNYLLGRGVSEADAEDVAQEVFVKLLRCLHYLDLTGDRFRGWLQRVADRTLADRRRAEGRRRHTEAEWFRRRPGAVLEDYRRELLEQSLERVRARTAPLTWRCFEGQMLQERRAAELAVECGLTVNAVRVRTSRVLARLRRLCRAARSGGTTAPFPAAARTLDCNSPGLPSAEKSVVTPVLLPRRGW
jgi:RNA polymerase sigma-70 factor (ECF subfamily)